MMTRRGFLKLGPAVPMLAVAGPRAGERFVSYSARARVGPWAGWIETRAGDVVAWVKRTGAVIRVPSAPRAIDWLARMSRNTRRGE